VTERPITASVDRAVIAAWEPHTAHYWVPRQRSMDDLPTQEHRATVRSPRSQTSQPTAHARIEQLAWLLLIVAEPVLYVGNSASSFVA
jgi:hypothetical protein